MNIRDLEYLVALSEYKHFRHAASACHVSQPTLSGQIRKLEEELGVMLLERTSRRVLFTQTGLSLVEQAKKVLLDVHLLKEMANRHGQEMSGPLHIGLIPTVAPYLLPHIMPMLHEEYPQLEMYLYEGQTQQLLSQLNGGKIDCAILASVKEAETFIGLPLYTESMKLAIPLNHPWHDREKVNLSELEGKKLLMLEDGHCLRDQALGFCFQAGVLEDTHFRATSLETLRSMIAAGMGMTLLPKLATPNQASRDGVYYIECVEPEPSRDIILIYRPGSPLRVCYEKLAKRIQEFMPSILKS